MKEEAEAKRIIESFYPFVEGIDVGERHRAACQCALIVVREIIQENHAMDSGDKSIGEDAVVRLVDRLDYWIEVRAILERS